MRTIACAGCGGWFPDVEGPTHRYMTSCPGCWAVYGQVLAKEYEDPAWSLLHRLTVDSYAAQHPGGPSPQSIQSVTLHLASMGLVLERHLPPDDATRALQTGTQLKDLFAWLEPPSMRGAMTINDVAGAISAEAHLNAVRAWAESVWGAWWPHHATIRALYSQLGVAGQGTYPR